jgi:hypothetical protein
VTSTLQLASGDPPADQQREASEQLWALVSVLQRGWQAAGGVSAGSELAAAGGAVASACARGGAALLRSELVQHSLWQQLQDLEALTESSSGDAAAAARYGSDQPARAGGREEVLACLLPLLRCTRAAVAMNAGLGVAEAPLEAFAGA